MKIRMTESFAVEADSIAEVEMAYAEGYIDEYARKRELVSVEFTEEKEKKEMENRTVTLTLKEFTELMRMADSFQLLKAAAKKDSYLSDLEKAVFGMHEEKAEEPTEDNF
jgi:hypothetical protein